MDGNVVVALSGSGRSLENFLDQEKSFHYKIVAVITSNLDCRGSDIAKQSQLPLFYYRADQDLTRSNLIQWLEKVSAHWIALAGFTQKFPILSGWKKRIVNIHPALLPKFGGKGMYGIHVHRAVLAAKAKKSGATLHFVNQNYDEGSIIAQISVDVKEGDTEHRLAKRVFAAECDLYPKELSALIDRE